MSLAVIRRTDNGSIEYPILGYKSLPDCVVYHINFTCKNNHHTYEPTGIPNQSSCCQYFISNRVKVKHAQFPITQRVIINNKMQSLSVDILLNERDYIYDVRDMCRGYHICDVFKQTMNRCVALPQWFLDIISYNDVITSNRLAELNKLVKIATSEKNNTSGGTVTVLS